MERPVAVTVDFRQVRAIADPPLHKQFGGTPVLLVERHLQRTGVLRAAMRGVSPGREQHRHGVDVPAGQREEQRRKALRGHPVDRRTGLDQRRDRVGAAGGACPHQGSLPTRIRPIGFGPGGQQPRDGRGRSEAPA